MLIVQILNVFDNIHIHFLVLLALQCSPSEVRKVYETQKSNTSPGDFCELVLEDKERIGLGLSDMEIRTMKKEKFRNIVKQKIRQTAFQYLKNLKGGHSKMNKLSYEKYEMSSYLNSPLFSSDDMKVLLGLGIHTRMYSIEN